MSKPNDYGHLQQPLTIIRVLLEHGIDPILYGSYGVSLYLGNFKDFSDIDLLLPAEWLDGRWEELQIIMLSSGFELVDLHEHEFENSNGLKVAFAPETVLIRDKIIDTLDAVIRVTVDQLSIRTLSPHAFKSAYTFSAKDGYRKDKRGKKDQEVIALLDAYLQAKASD